MEAWVKYVSNRGPERILVPDKSAGSESPAEEAGIFKLHSSNLEGRDPAPKVFEFFSHRLVGHVAFRQMGVGFGENEKDKKRAATSKRCLKPTDHTL